MLQIRPVWKGWGAGITELGAEKLQRFPGNFKCPNVLQPLFSAVSAEHRTGGLILSCIIRDLGRSVALKPQLHVQITQTVSALLLPGSCPGW